MVGNNPFDKTHYAALIEAERRLHDVLSVIDSGQACGFECNDLRQARDDFAGQIAAIKREFFTPPPG